MSEMRMIKDDPWFNSNNGNDSYDAFNHEVFADTMFNIIKDNNPPLTIGLFGGWGVGKSSIINLLKYKISSCNEKYATIYFNAWAYSEDSFRRQFLITLVKDLIVNKADKEYELERLKKLNYAKVLEEIPGESLKELWDKGRSDGLFKSLKKEVAVAFQNVKLADIGVVRIIFSSLFLIIAILFLIVGLIYEDNETKRWGTFSLVLSIANFFAPKIENVFVLKRKEVFDAKLLFPEQFEEEYSHLIKKYGDRYDKIVIVIDDLDRCDVDTIKKVLVTLKNFLGQQKTIFIVPLDDSSVVSMFKGENHNFGYEQLRKYFNISIRIPELHNEDIIDFAERIAHEYNIPADVAVIASLGYCNDARKIKHFLNLYKIKEAIVIKRKKSGYLGDIQVDNYKKQIAKLVVLEYQFPEFYRFITKYPKLLDGFTAYSIDPKCDIPIQNINEINENISEIEQLWTSFYGLKGFLRRTSDIGFDDIEVLSKLKITNNEQELSQNGINFSRLIFEGYSDEIEQIFTKDICERYGNHIANTIIKYLNSSSTYIKENTSKLAIILLKTKLLPNNICLNIINELLREIFATESYIKINENNIIIFVTFFDSFSHYQKQQLIKKILDDTIEFNIHKSDLHTIIEDECFIRTIQYDFKIADRFSVILNSGYNQATNREEKLNSLLYLSKIKLNKKQRSEFGFICPDKSLIEHLIDELDEDISKFDKVLNKNIIEILTDINIPFDLKEVSEVINEKFVSLVTANLEGNDLNDIFHQVYKVLRYLPEFFENDQASTISKLIIQRYTNFNTAKSKLELLFLLVYCYQALENRTENASVFSHYCKFLLGLDPDDLCNHFEDIMSNLYDDKEDNNKIIVKITSQLWDNIKDNYLSEDGTTFSHIDILAKYNSNINYEGILSFLKELVCINDVDALRIWKVFIKDKFITLLFGNQEELLQVIIKNIKDEEIEYSIRENYFDLLLELLSIVNIDNFQSYFSMLMIYTTNPDDIDYRKLFCTYFDNLTNIFGEETPKAMVNTILNSLLLKNDLDNYKDVINICIKYASFVTQNVWNNLANKIIIDLFNSDLDIDHQFTLLFLAEYIPSLTDNFEQLSDVLYNFKNNGHDDNLRGKAWEIYSLLLKHGVIQEFEEHI